MNVYLLVEGNSDAAFFRRLLPPDVQMQTTIVVAGERTNITSIARSLMVTRRKPLALVTDSDSVDKDTIEQRRQTIVELLESVAAGLAFKVIVAVPEIESWFFVVPEVLERVIGTKLSPEQRKLGEFRPKEALRLLFKGQATEAVAQLTSELTESEVKTLQETEPTKGLIEFLAKQVSRKTEPQPA